MSTKFTPGPWKPSKGHKSGLILGISAEGRNIVNFHGISSATKEESQANAKLIIAAPDLYEALKELAEEAFLQMAGGKGHLIDNAFAALKKAQS